MKRTNKNKKKKKKIHIDFNEPPNTQYRVELLKFFQNYFERKHTLPKKKKRKKEKQAKRKIA